MVCEKGAGCGERERHEGKEVHICQCISVGPSSPRENWQRSGVWQESDDLHINKHY